ncbi:CTD kinase subunit gamma [Teratosphaeria destructans]|uniref:CTD kinase subunit gamma n=1 Tax=Teratosphaeria destructans TaxID=418781 RepID=A0A9W7W4C3_9PEZI|nr:CTD kinase subunit gamma [Teratosphaeria destructans]
MADPFEVRMRFTSQLQHLNASTTSASKTAAYALKYAEFSDDLHSCILEQLERNNMNNRANIMYFLPALCDTAKEKGEWAYVRMMERDILRIVDAVAPDDGSGAANVKVVRKVLGLLEGKGYLQRQTVGELGEILGGRDSLAGLEVSPPHVSQSQQVVVGMETARSTPTRANVHAAGGGRESLGGGGGVGIRLDKRQIEQRIEEDRERHKRAREGIWAVQQVGSGLREDAEFERMWGEVNEVDDDDFGLAREDAVERRGALEYEEVV